MGSKSSIPATMEDFVGRDGVFLVHVRGVYRDLDGEVWVRSDAPLKLPILLVNPKNWISVEKHRRPDGVFATHGRPGSGDGKVNWENAAPVRQGNVTWFKVEFHHGS